MAGFYFHSFDKHVHYAKGLYTCSMKWEILSTIIVKHLQCVCGLDHRICSHAWMNALNDAGNQFVI